MKKTATLFSCRQSGLFSFFKNNVKILLMLFFLFSGLFLTTIKSDAQGIDFRQGANRDNFKDGHDYVTGELHWINSILISSNSRYIEGMSTIQRIVFNDLPTCGSGNHVLRIKLEAKKSTQHAYDFITSWDNAFKATAAIAPGFGLMPANRADAAKLHECGPGISSDAAAACGAATTIRDIPIIFGDYANPAGPGESNLLITGPPADENTTRQAIQTYECRYGDNIVVAAGQYAGTYDRSVRVKVAGSFTGANGDANNAVLFVGYGDANPNDGGDTYIYYDIKWSSASPSVVIEFAAHIAVGVDNLAATDPGGCNVTDLGVGYLLNHGASAINGGPYHVIIEDFQDAPGNTPKCEGNLGNQDNQLQGSEILLIPECDLLGPSAVCANGIATYTATVTNPDNEENASNSKYKWEIINSSQSPPPASIIGVDNGNVPQVPVGQTTVPLTITVNTGGVGTYTVKLTISNGAATNTTDDDLSSSCTVTTTVTGGPVIDCPDNTTVNACQTQLQINNAYVAWLATVTPSDASSNGGTVGPDKCGGVKIVTFTAANDCGTATCSASFTVTADVTAPGFTGNYADVPLGCNPTDPNGSLGTASATDACGGVTITPSDGDVVTDGCNRSRKRTFIATDGCNNTSSTSRTVRWVVDITPPVITTGGGSTSLGCNPSASDINAGLGTATASDGCGGRTLTPSDGSITSDGCSRSQKRTWFAIDACGNTNTAARTVTWTSDPTPPTFTGNYNDVTLTCNSDIAPGSLGSASATDACSIPSITSTTGDIGTDGCLRSLTRTFKATDGCGNTATVSRTVRWKAVLSNPILTIGGQSIPSFQEFDLGCDPSELTIEGTLSTANATNGCAIPTVSPVTTNPTGSTSCERVRVRTFTATDDCGHIVTAARLVRWIANLGGPQINPNSAPTVLGCNPSASDIEGALGSVSATDACTNVTITPSDGPIESNGCSRSKTRTWTATGGCGNTATASRSVTWTADNNGPTITTGGTTTSLGCNPVASDINGALGTASATDACSTPTTTPNDGTITTDGCSRSQKRTWTSRDACGNTSTAARTVTWTVDITGPTITTGGTTTSLGCNPVASDINGALGTATATDACSPPTTTPNDGPITTDGCSRSQKRTWTSIDACGNTSTAARTVTWTSDNTGPTITTGGTTTSLGCNPVASDINGALGTATATDACSPPTTTPLDGPITTDGCSRSQKRTWTSRDACGNTSTAARTVTWTSDITGPVLTCAASYTAACGTTNPEFTPPSASDACGTPTTVQWGDVVVQGECPTTYTKKWISRDACGNTSTCSQTVTVPCCSANCTYTQGKYGQDKDISSSCDGTTSPNNPYIPSALIEHNLLAYGGLLRVGCVGHSVTISTGEAKCVLAALPGGGGSGPLTVAGDFSICNLPEAYLTKKGTINNALLAQTITLGLNLGINPSGGLGNFAIQPNKYLVTADLVACGSTTVKECTFNCTPNPNVIGQYIWTVATSPYHVSDCRFSQALYNALSTKNVAGLYALANSALCGNALPAGVSYGDITDAVDCINNAFDECRAFTGWFTEKPTANSFCTLPSATTPCPAPVTRITSQPVAESVAEVTSLKVSAYPNPFRDKVSFVINSQVSGQGSLQVYNMLGQRVATVYNGTIVAGRSQIVEYNAPRSFNGGMIYIFRVGGKQVTGKLMNIE